MSFTSITTPIPRSRATLSGHGLRLFAAYATAVTLILALAIYGFDYYMLPESLRPYSPKHLLLRPTGVIGLKLGIVGLFMFLLIFLYPLRKRWPWLLQMGVTKHWMDFHVMLGLTAPFIIAFHSSFKFRGFAGMAFWIMTAVAVSGIIGRYLYSQIPRRVTAAEVSLNELRELQERYTAQLSLQHCIPAADLQALFRLPSAGKVARMNPVLALLEMITLDVLRPWRIARLRRHTLTLSQSLLTLGGLRRSHKPEVESVVEIARDQAYLSKRVVFLSRTQQLFHLWHVVHRPFSYSFAVLAIIHIAVVWMFGFI